MSDSISIQAKGLKSFGGVSTIANFSPYLLSLLFPSAVVIGNLLGGWYAGVGILLAFVIYPFCDVAFGKDDRTPHLPLSPLLANALIISQAMLHIAAVGTLVRLVIIDGATLPVLLATVSTGLNSGLSMVVVTHELIHRKSRALTSLGLMLLWTVNYLHFYIEHVRGHHLIYSQAEDAATASKHESYWDHLPKTIILQYIDAWRIESTTRRSVVQNRMLHYSLITIATWMAALFFLGAQTMAFWLLHCAIAIAALEYANFIFHWGLEQDDDAGSWQILNRWSRWVTLRHNYHADHHFNPHKPCYELQTHPTSPTLPSGFFGCLYVAALPQVWIPIMRMRLPLDTTPDRTEIIQNT